MEYPFCFGEDPRDVNEYNTYAERMQGGNKILRAKLICSNVRTASRDRMQRLVELFQEVNVREGGAKRGRFF